MTYEHANSAPTPATCLLLEGGSGAQGYPGSPSFPFPTFEMSKDPGTSIIPSKAASIDGLKPGTPKDPDVTVARSGASTDRVSTSFTRPPLACDDTWAPAAHVRAGTFTIFHFVGAPCTISISQECSKLPPTLSRL
jgi:hypothetical protein